MIECGNPSDELGDLPGLILLGPDCVVIDICGDDDDAKFDDDIFGGSMLLVEIAFDMFNSWCWEVSIDDRVRFSAAFKSSGDPLGSWCR